ncbi:Septin-5 [Fasciola hepatica]|uniref:Septin-5 n=1 Tax=Fasciola hepatica TaxID=6192 RepID=A0A4E0RTG5_FASHE|nr:Septin-5 [Fasciola hepatica]
MKAKTCRLQNLRAGFILQCLIRATRVPLLRLDVLRTAVDRKVSIPRASFGKRKKTPHRLIDTLSRWTGRAASRTRRGFPTDFASSNLSSSASEVAVDDLSGCSTDSSTSSLVFDVIHDRQQFAALVCPPSNADQDSNSGSCYTLTPGVPAMSNVVQSYISALEMAELESRRETGTMRPIISGSPPVNSSALERTRSVYDPSRRMRPVLLGIGVPMKRTRQWSGQSEEDARLGFGNLPDQMHRKAVKKGFNFTLMVVGESGLGKSTLINSLFMQDLYKDREVPDAGDRVRSTTQIEKRQIELDERGVKLRLTVVDTPGFNDAVNCTDCWKPIEDYIDGTFEQYFKDECGLNRKNIHDHRVHCCLYFISPYGHGLRQVDVAFMRRLQHKVNIVPIIAKADALTAAELHTFKERIMSDFDRYKIDIYRLPECDSDEEEEIKRLDKEIKSVLPFAVIGSNCVVEVDGHRVRGRQYPWGVVEVENTKHCDFTKLRVFLLKTHMQDLKDMTLDVHYENYRAKYITERMSKRQTDRREGGGLRSDRENGPGFEAIVDHDSLLKQKEEELQRMQQMMSKMQEQMKRSLPTPALATATPNSTPATGLVTSTGGVTTPAQSSQPISAGGIGALNHA